MCGHKNSILLAMVLVFASACGISVQAEGPGGAKESSAPEKSLEKDLDAQEEIDGVTDVEAINALQDQTDSFDDWTIQEFHDVADIVCDGLDEFYMEDMVQTVSDSTNSGSEAGALVTYAVMMRCTQHEEELLEWMN